MIYDDAIVFADGPPGSPPSRRRYVAISATRQHALPDLPQNLKEGSNFLRRGLARTMLPCQRR
jgi:hypothetical protein